MSGIAAPGSFGMHRSIEDRTPSPVEPHPQTPRKTTARVAGKAAITEHIEVQPKIITLDLRRGDTAQPFGGLVDKKELAALGNLWEAAKFPPRSETEWDKQLRATARALLVQHGNTVIGFARMTQDATTAVFRDGTVAPDYQGMGIFSAMVNRGVHEAKLLGCQSIQLDPAPGTEDMYRHLGWTEAEL